MILQALAQYYYRKCTDPHPKEPLAPLGFEPKELPFILELDAHGRPIQIEDTREADGRRKNGTTFLVPQAAKKSVNIAANLLWGKAEYVLGLSDPKKSEKKRKEGKGHNYRDRLTEMHRAFVENIARLGPQVCSDVGIQAVLAFLADLDLSALEKLPQWHEVRTTNPNLSFRLQGDAKLVCQRPTVVKAIQEAGAAIDGTAFCLVSGERDKIERLHPPIKGVWGAQMSGANIVSFNLDAFNSYGKRQGANAPIGKRAAFAYTTALNHLLRRDSPQRIQVGDASTVFWAEKPAPLETGIVDIFGEPPKDDPDRNVRAVKSLYQSAQTGGYATDWDETRFYVLGLAPNVARIAIRFWHVSTIAELARNIRQHFVDLEIARPDYASPYPSLFRLLRAIAVQDKADNIPPNLAGDVMRSILTGMRYPDSLLQTAVRAVRRARVEHEVSYFRAALIKACINRKTRCRDPNLSRLFRNYGDVFFCQVMQQVARSRS